MDTKSERQTREEGRAVTQVRDHCPGPVRTQREHVGRGHAVDPGLDDPDQGLAQDELVPRASKARGAR
jgi:hypothetical protein